MEEKIQRLHSLQTRHSEIPFQNQNNFIWGVKGENEYELNI